LRMERDRGREDGSFGTFTGLIPSASLACAAMALVLLSAAQCTASESKQTSWNRSAELKKAGYVELSGDDAVRFLVGNSMLMKKSSPGDGQKDGMGTGSRIYYFLNDHTMYDCGAAEEKESGCFVEAWHLKDNEICPIVGSCLNPTPAKIMRSPLSNGRAKDGRKLGVYLQFDHFAYDIVKGNRTDGLLFDTQISARRIELDRADLDKEIREARDHGDGDKQIPVYVPRASALLIGNTFLSGDFAGPSKDQAANVCPKEGAYYSPDGTVIRFTCNASPDPLWTIMIARWEIEAGQFCGAFGGCTRVPMHAIPAPQESGASDKMLVQDLTNGNALTGYAGNLFNFRFERHRKIGKAEKKSAK